MEDKDIIHKPLTREGALKLGKSPCELCEAGWGWATYGQTKDGKVDIKHCHETCEYYRRYMEKEKIEIICGTEDE